MLICVRFLLLSVSIIVDAVDYMKQGLLVMEEIENDNVPLGTEEINEAIVYILHYGRPLYRGDGQPNEQDQPDIEELDQPDQMKEYDDFVDVHVPITTAATTPIKIAAIPNTFQILEDDGFESASDEVSPPTSPQEFTKPTNEHKPAAQSQSPASDSKPAAIPAQPEPPSNKSWIEMTAAEFRAYCDVNGKPNPDSFSESNLPPNFEKSPPKAVYKEGSTREEYKAFMVAKYDYETWENKLVLFKIKLKKKLDEIKWVLWETIPNEVSFMYKD